MKKGNFLKNLIFLLALVCLWIFPHLFLSSEIDLQKNREQNLIADLKVVNDKLERIVEQDLRRLQAEQNILPFAEDSLGLVRSLKPFDEIKINDSRVKRIRDIVNKEYD